MLGIVDKILRHFRPEYHKPLAEKARYPAAQPLSKNRITSTEKDPHNNVEEDTLQPTLSAANVNHDFYQNLLNKPLKLKYTTAHQQKSLKQLLESLIKSTQLREKVTPRLPTVLPRLLQCLRDDASNINDIVEFIQQDPNVAANVLRSSNSILYNPAGKHIDSFHRAVVIIGRSGLKSIACTAMMKPISNQKYSGNEHFGKQLWAHSLRTAIGAQLLAEPFDLNPFTAYLAGLFHNIGEITLFNLINRDTTRSEIEKANDFYYLQQQGLDTLSHQIIKLWQLTDEISDIFSGNASSEMLDVLDKAVTLSQAIYLLEEDKISQTEFYQLTVNFGLKKHICDQTIEIAHQTLNPTQH